MEVVVAKLLFDQDNPRHVHIEDEPAIIHRLYAQEKVLALAKKIVALEGVSPLDRPAIIEHPNIAGRFIVLEGNRRLCALKLLADPARAPTPAARRAMAALAEQASRLPTKVDAVLFPSRSAARPWIALRHEGEQGGAGTKKWNSTQTTRHSLNGGSPGNPNALALALTDYAEKRTLITSEERRAIALTTLTRYLNNPVLRDTLGLVNARAMEIDVDQVEFDGVLRRFLSDALPGTAGGMKPVNSRANTDAVKKYAQSLRTEGIAPTSRTATGTPDPASSGGPKKVKGRSSVHPDKRPRIVPSAFKVTSKNALLLRLFDELRTIDPEALAFAGAYLLRAFVEQTVHLYARKHALGHEGLLNEVVRRCAGHLETAGADRKVLKVLQEMGNDKHSRISPDGLGAWVHGSSIPTAVELKRRWDTLEGSLILDEPHRVSRRPVGLSQTGTI